MRPKKSPTYFKDLNINFSDYQVFLDIDGTIVSDMAEQLDEETLAKVKELKEKNKLFFCTNSRNTDRNQHIVGAFKVDLISNEYRKPDPRVLGGLTLSDKKIVIGDKLFTDGFLARNIKAEFIKVKRIISGRENSWTRLINRLDDLAFFIASRFNLI